MSDQFREVFIDFLPNQPKNEQTLESSRQMLRQQFEQRLPSAVERIWDLPPIMVWPSETYHELLLEARHLFVDGYFYSCVAMCGIVGERLLKDMFRASILIQKAGQLTIPASAALDQLERTGARTITEFLSECGLLGDAAQQAAEKLQTLRNRYAHASGSDPQEDAISALSFFIALWNVRYQCSKILN